MKLEDYAEAFEIYEDTHYRCKVCKGHSKLLGGRVSSNAFDCVFKYIE